MRDLSNFNIGFMMWELDIHFGCQARILGREKGAEWASGTCVETRRCRSPGHWEE